MNCSSRGPEHHLTTNERRQTQRFPLALQLRYHASSPASSASPSLTGAGRTENISKCGLLFRRVGNLEVGSHIVLEVDLAPETEWRAIEALCFRLGDPEQPFCGGSRNWPVQAQSPLQTGWTVRRSRCLITSGA
jgi:hypothetical protein